MHVPHPNCSQTFKYAVCGSNKDLLGLWNSHLASCAFRSICRLITYPRGGNCPSLTPALHPHQMSPGPPSVHVLRDHPAIHNSFRLPSNDVRKVTTHHRSEDDLQQQTRRIDAFREYTVFCLLGHKTPPCVLFLPLFNAENACC